MMLGSCSSTALSLGLMISEVSEISLHITAVSGSNMPMEMVGSEVLDFGAAQKAGKVPALVLPTPVRRGLNDDG